MSVDLAVVKTFFENIFEDGDPGQIILVQKKGKYFRKIGHFDLIADAVVAVNSWRGDGNLYVKVNRMHNAMIEARSKTGIGGKAEIACVRVLTLDCDTDVKNGKYPSRQELMATFGGGVVVSPTMLVASDGTGVGGVHAYWKLRVAETDISYCDTAAQVLLDKVKADCGKDVDNAYGVERVLRVAGVTRSDGKEVKLIGGWSVGGTVLLDAIADPVEVSMRTTVIGTLLSGASVGVGHSIIEEHLETLGILDCVDYLVGVHGWHFDGVDEFTRPGGSSGMPSAKLFLAQNGKLGVTILTSGVVELKPLTWYSLAHLYVALECCGNWTKAAKQCRKKIDNYLGHVFSGDELNRMTDLAAAGRILEKLEGKFVFFQNQCYRWTGTQWLTDESNLFLLTVIRLLDEEASKCDWGDEKLQEKWIGYYRGFANTKNIRGVKLLLEGLLHVDADFFACDPEVLYTDDGAYSLRTGLKLTDYARCNLHVTAVTPDFSEDCPKWEKFLLETCCGDAELVAYLQRVLGYCLTGLTSESVMWFFSGHGSNGKSVLLNLVSHCMGKFACSAPQEMLTGDSASNFVLNSIANLMSVRLAIVSEIRERSVLQEFVVKKLVGSESVVAKKSHKDPMEFMPTHKLVIGCNARPQVNGDEHAIWRRIRLVKFQNTVENPNRGLIDELKLEAPGILAWLVRGSVEYFKVGLEAPGIVEAAAERYREESDVLGMWINERCQTWTDYANDALAVSPKITREDFYELRDTLYEDYKFYLQTCHGIRNPMTLIPWVRAVSKRGFNLVKRGHDEIRIFDNVKLRAGINF